MVFLPRKMDRMFLFTILQSWVRVTTHLKKDKKWNSTLKKVPKDCRPLK